MSEKMTTKKSEIGWHADNCPSAEVIFSNAREHLKENTGLELTNIELVKLKEIAADVEKALKEGKPNMENDFGPVGETMARFLSEFYGIDIPIHLWHETGIKKVGKSAEAVKEWFRQKQREQFLP